MKYFYPLILLVFFSFQAYTQSKKIVVADSIDKFPLPYASIIALNKKAGFYTNDKGVVTIPDNLYDTFLINYNGYVAKKIALGSVNDTIFLIRTYNQLEEIVVQKFIKQRKVGDFKYNRGLTSGAHFSFIQASKISINNSGKVYTIKKIYIPVKYQKYDVDTPILRVHLYKIDANTGMPGEDILAKPVFLNWENIKRKKFYIDISEQHIVLDDAELFIGFEGIYDKGKFIYDGIRFSPAINRKQPINLFSKNAKSYHRKPPLGNESFLMALETTNSYKWQILSSKFAAGLIISE